jgi:hypothetical protein
LDQNKKRLFITRILNNADNKTVSVIKNHATRLQHIQIKLQGKYDRRLAEQEEQKKLEKRHIHDAHATGAYAHGHTPLKLSSDDLEIVGFDIEKVILEKSLMDGTNEVAGSVCLWSAKTKSIIYQSRVKHKEADLVLDDYRHKHFGIDGRNGELDKEEYPSLEEVREILKVKMKGKLIVTCDGTGDWNGVQIPKYHPSFKQVDLKDLFKRSNGQGCGLRGLAQAFLKDKDGKPRNIQVKGKPHTASEDAECTALLYEVYLEHKASGKKDDYDYVLSNKDYRDMEMTQEKDRIKKRKKY